MGLAKITVLVEDTANGHGLLPEHGFSVWIEMRGRRFLFDTGQGDALQENARDLGIALSLADAVLLSHGHYDHTGGLMLAANAAPEAKIYMHPDALEPKYSCKAEGSCRYVGIPPATKKHIQQHCEIIWTEKLMEVGVGLYLTGPIRRVHHWEDTGGLFYKDGQAVQPDDLIDDQAAFFEIPEGIVVILGCAHSGVINTLHHIQEQTNRPIYAVIGGMHLLRAPSERMDFTMEAFQNLGVQRVYPGHCTGLQAVARFWHDLRGRCSPCSAGTVMEFDA